MQATNWVKENRETSTRTIREGRVTAELVNGRLMLVIHDRQTEERLVLFLNNDETAALRVTLGGA